MVLSRKYFQSVEIYRFSVVDTWKTCVTVDFHHTTTLIIPRFLQPVQGKVCSGSLFFHSPPIETDINSVPRSYKIS